MQALRSVTAGLSQHPKVTGLEFEMEKHKRPCENHVASPYPAILKGV